MFRVGDRVVYMPTMAQGRVVAWLNGAQGCWISFKGSERDQFAPMSLLRPLNGVALFLRLVPGFHPYDDQLKRFRGY